MKKVWLLLLGATYCAHADQTAPVFECIDAARVAQAESVITRDVTRIAARQAVIRKWATAVALGVGGFALYQWLFANSGNSTGGGQGVGQPIGSGKPADGGQPVGQLSCSESTQKVVSEAQALSFKEKMKHAAYWVGSTTGGIAKGLASLVATGAVMSYASTVSSRLIAAYDQTQKPVLNWEWMTGKYTHLNESIDQLKYVAAALDSRSPVLDPCNNLAITIQSDATASVAVQQSDSYLAVQELLRLRAAALKGEYDQTHGIADVGCMQLSQRWQYVVRAVEHCLAYISFCKKRLEAPSALFAFEINELDYVEQELMRRTNLVAQQLAAMMAGLDQALRAHASTGLLLLTYEYGNWVQHYGALLARNELLRAG